MANEMQAQAIAKYGAPLAARALPLPQPKGHEILLQVSHCGVCHSDVHLHDGHFDLGGGQALSTKRDDMELVLGHEIEGTIAAIGPEVKGVKIGDRRVVYPWIGCGDCAVCNNDREHHCPTSRYLGINQNGGFASHCLVPHERYLLDAEGVPEGLAATYMCSGLTAYAAVQEIADHVQDRPVLIMGLGGVGMMGLQFAMALLKGDVLAADMDEHKLQAALGAGAKGAYNTKDKEAVKRIMAETNGGVAAVLDFVGAEATIGVDTACLARGGRVVLVGLYGGAWQTPLPLFALRPFGVMGSFVGSLGQAKAMMRLVQQGKIKPIPVETRPLTQASQALDDLRQGKVLGRVVLTP